ncbi:MAG: type I-E CRISPR-associated endoribonuclease Cas2e [Casimicrobiaceae bacterium]|nr:type I-E CRISPR-associated endoribonuclease Cas2e [Casimicrobiaceae bacterium]MCX8098517.1 type I-E CRISPR-associated endoribonuclease Cas2e [Casimicrobiaceae bacterium]MDW8312126.1 type I-E CRISPR-associated endoribonuclease Cas2e [Burkholderiales bacterium]
MSMTVVATRNVSPRVRGFLASAMLEIAAGVYVAPRISPAVRERVWEVLAQWFLAEHEASIVLLWHEPQSPGGLGVRVLGSSPVELVEIDQLLLARRPLPKDAL